jgi:hypothetical protein
VDAVEEDGAAVDEEVTADRAGIGEDPALDLRARAPIVPPSRMSVPLLRSIC